ncbi:MAG: hypothetical protein Tsb0016_22980 [Sphingomonadales bacterium]
MRNDNNSFPAASLTSALLARKGAASPARTNSGGYDALAQDLAHDLAANRPVRHQAAAAPVAGTYAAPAVIDTAAAVAAEDAPSPQDAAMVEAPPAPEKPVKPRAASGSRGKAAMTVRLDAERHFKLRLLSAHINRSSQQILIDALDQYLSQHGADISPHMCACASAIAQ